MATQPKRGPCMQVVAITLQLIWFNWWNQISSRTTKWKPGPYSRGTVTTKTVCVLSHNLSEKKHHLGIFYNHFDVVLNRHPFRQSKKRPFYAHTCALMARFYSLMPRRTHRNNVQIMCSIIYIKRFCAPKDKESHTFPHIYTHTLVSVKLFALF